MLCLGSQSDTGYVSSSGEVKESSPPDNEADDMEPNDEECGMLHRARPNHLSLDHKLNLLDRITLFCYKITDNWGRA